MIYSGEEKKNSLPRKEISVKKMARQQGKKKLSIHSGFVKEHLSLDDMRRAELLFAKLTVKAVLLDTSKVMSSKSLSKQLTQKQLTLGVKECGS